MELMNIIKTRKSVRSYTDQNVEDEKITKVLEAARLAPSAKNKQCWRYMVIKDAQTINEICKAAKGNKWLKDAPVVIVACGNKDESFIRDDFNYYAIDVAISFEHLVLVATEEGLGTCWIGSFEEDKIKAILNIPDEYDIIALTPLGYPKDKEKLWDKTVKFIAGSKKRKSFEEIICYEKWDF